MSKLLRMLAVIVGAVFLMAGAAGVVANWGQHWRLTEGGFLCGLFGSSYWLARYGISGSWG